MVRVRIWTVRCGRFPAGRIERCATLTSFRSRSGIVLLKRNFPHADRRKKVLFPASGSRGTVMFGYDAQQGCWRRMATVDSFLRWLSVSTATTLLGLLKATPQNRVDLQTSPTRKAEERFVAARALRPHQVHRIAEDHHAGWAETPRLRWAPSLAIRLEARYGNLRGALLFETAQGLAAGHRAGVRAPEQRRAGPRRAQELSGRVEESPLEGSLRATSGLIR